MTLPPATRFPFTADLQYEDGEGARSRRPAIAARAR